MRWCQRDQRHGQAAIEPLLGFELGRVTQRFVVVGIGVVFKQSTRHPQASRMSDRAVERGKPMLCALLEELA